MSFESRLAARVEKQRLEAKHLAQQERTRTVEGHMGLNNNDGTIVDPNPTGSIVRQPPDGLEILLDPQSKAILEDRSWQEELGTFAEENLRLYAEMDGRQCGRLSAQLRVRKSPTDGLTIEDRYVHLGNVEVVDDERYRRRGIGSTLLNEMERHARRFNASRIEGTISAIDLPETPTLPEFYQRRGYLLTPKGAGFTMVKSLQ